MIKRDKKKRVVADKERGSQRHTAYDILEGMWPQIVLQMFGVTWKQSR